jgi:hypothetical protein
MTLRNKRLVYEVGRIKKSGTAEQVPDVIEKFRNEKTRNEFYFNELK